jgi:hypothetical protein
VFELDAAFSKVGDEGGDDGEGPGTFCETAETDMPPPTPQSLFEDRPTNEEKRTPSPPQSPHETYEETRSPSTPLFPSEHRPTHEKKRTLLTAPNRRSIKEDKYILKKLGYLEATVEPQYERKSSFEEPISGREICVELDGWYVIAACLQISVEELHEMMVRMLEKRAAGGDGGFDED